MKLSIIIPVRNEKFLIKKIVDQLQSKLKILSYEIIFIDDFSTDNTTEVIKELIKLSPDKIIYVSCNSSTQARDLKLLKFNYSLLKSKAIDMFPHTQHVENIVLLGKI